jgi:phosphatidylglycerol:prolipoprotein diacylglycerol transferase
MNFLEITPFVFEGGQLTWYSVFVLTGAILTLIISNFLYKRDPESKKCPDLVFNTFLVAFPMGLVGARIWFVLSELEWYRANPIEILQVWEGGLAIQGGVLLGAACGIAYAAYSMKKHNMNLKITTLMDMIIPNILIAQVCGRWGNFFNREVYGECVDHLYALKNWWMLPDWLVQNMQGGFSGGVYVSCPGNEYAQPLFLYEGLLNFVGFILITIVLRNLFKKRIDGTLSAFYLIWYGVVRVCLEGYRNEKFIMRWGEVSQSVVTSIAYIVLGVAFIASLYVIKYRNSKKEVVIVGEEVEKEKADVSPQETHIDEKEENVSKVKKNTRKVSTKKEDK